VENVVFSKDSSKPKTPTQDPDRVETDANGEVIPACVARRHWWYLIRPNVYRCKHCQNHGKNVIKYQPGGWGGR
jgi:hypothetical protein